LTEHRQTVSDCTLSLFRKRNDVGHRDSYMKTKMGASEQLRMRVRVQDVFRLHHEELAYVLDRISE